MQQLQGVEGVVQLVEHEYVKTNGIPDSTLIDIEALSKRGQLTKEQLRMINELQDYRREQVNIVETPFGRPLRMFKSIRELFRVFIDIADSEYNLNLPFGWITYLTFALTAIQRLHSKKILHRDISLRNILIADDTDGNYEGRGLLIDFDCAIQLKDESSKAPIGRTVSQLIPPFPDCFLSSLLLTRARFHTWP